MIQTGQRLILIFSLLFLTVGCDQATKALARDTLPTTGPLTYFQGMIRLEHAENPGAFLSLGAQLPEHLRTLIFTVTVALVLISGLIYLLIQKGLDWPQTLAGSLLLAGGFGNLMDRMVKGTVTDFLNFGIGSWRTGIFNLADMAIVTAILILVFHQRIQKYFTQLSKI
ncbi:MAG: signal peptidase II [Pseudobdellovibrionaceae bacterium]